MAKTSTYLFFNKTIAKTIFSGFNIIHQTDGQEI